MPSSSAPQQQQQQIERLISNRELFASMTLEAYDEKEDAKKSQQKVTNAQAKKDYEERERQNINTRHVIHCMKRALFRSLSLREMREALRPLDPGTDFDMMTKVNFDGVHTSHDGPTLAGLCCPTVVTREDEIRDQRAELEGDGMARPAYMKRKSTTKDYSNNKTRTSSSSANVNNHEPISSFDPNSMSGTINTLNNTDNGIIRKKNQDQDAMMMVNAANKKNKNSSSSAASTSKVLSPKSNLPPSSASAARKTNNHNNRPTLIPVDDDEEELVHHQSRATAGSPSPRLLDQQNNTNNNKNKLRPPSHQPATRKRRRNHSNNSLSSSFRNNTTTNSDDSYTDDDSDNNLNGDSSSSSDDETDYDLEFGDIKNGGGGGGTNNYASPSIVDNPQGINTEHVDPTKNIQFQFTDFAPMCYRHIRHFFGIEPENFLKVLVESNWHSIPTPGKSSAQLYFCGQNWVIKTMTSGESDFLSRILHRYYYHVRDNPHTLLPHFVGHHRLKFKDVDGSDMEFTFVIMQNVFATPLKIHTKFDLKGSTVGRFATAEEKKKTTCTQKDLDINRPLRLGEQRKNLLVEQLRRDCDFLRRSEIMDYSFLVGIHDMSKGYPVWHNVVSSSLSGQQNSTNSGIFGDFNSVDFDANLERQEQIHLKSLHQQQQQHQQQNVNNSTTTSSGATPITASASAAPPPPPPLLSVTNPSMNMMMTSAASQKSDPISGLDPAGTLSSTATSATNFNNNLASSSASNVMLMNNTNNNANSSSQLFSSLTAGENQQQQQQGSSSSAGELSHRRKRAQSGIHNHPHLQPYQQQQQQYVDPMSNIVPNTNTTNNNSSHATGTITPSSGGGGANYYHENTASNQPNFPNNNNHEIASNSNNNNNRSRNNSNYISTNPYQQQQDYNNNSTSNHPGFVSHNNNNNNNNASSPSAWINDERCFTADSGGMLSLRRDEIYYLGVIDILQEYNWWKRAETVIMGTVHDREHISSVDPRHYAMRFIDFMESIVI